MTNEDLFSSLFDEEEMEKNRHGTEQDEQLDHFHRRLSPILYQLRCVWVNENLVFQSMIDLRGGLIHTESRTHTQTHNRNVTDKLPVRW